jgi:uncharacterized membrane protein HdeD (DUF308 family)
MTSRALSPVTAIAFPQLVTRNWWFFLLRGLAAITFGLLSLIRPGISLVTLMATFLWPGLTALTLSYFIAGWIVATGLLQVIGAIELRKAIENEWWLILYGAMPVSFGILLFSMPGPSAVDSMWLIAVFAVTFGILMVGFAFKVKNSEKA